MGNAELFEKGKAVLNSCTTADQLRVALQYKHRIMRIWMFSGADFVWEEMLTQVLHDKQKSLGLKTYVPMPPRAMALLPDK